MKFKTIDEFNFNGKVALVRFDLNSPVDKKTGKIEKSARLEAHAKTLKELCRKNAKVVILAHQGRQGGYDFLPLEQHAKNLSEESGVEVKFVPDVAGEEAKKAIEGLKAGGAILLDNVRKLDDETEGKPAEASIVKALAPLAQVFVLDAFSVAHRAHASVVGFAGLIPI
ncbi:phosphoglycerate kinase, partial [Candidatus Micrarchaeota archaeon]